MLGVLPHCDRIQCSHCTLYITPEIKVCADSLLLWAKHYGEMPTTPGMHSKRRRCTSCASSRQAVKPQRGGIPGSLSDL